jgi:hypothetical protein
VHQPIYYRQPQHHVIDQISNIPLVNEELALTGL